MKGVLAVLVAAMVVLAHEVEISTAVTCNPTELSPCMGAIMSSSKPSPQCCAKIKQQKPCLCQYIRNPNLKQFVTSPNARKVSNTCGVPMPKC
ncbi:hypothetical protein NMG60_11002332 [Bertholletia excelsa]